MLCVLCHHLYCPCDRAVARRSYVIINDAMMAAARAAARKAKMAADRAGTELAGCLWFGPFYGPFYQLVSAFLFWVCLALLWHLYITYSLWSCPHPRSCPSPWACSGF